MAVAFAWLYLPLLAGFAGGLVPASWRELHARGQKLMRLGVEGSEVPERLGVTAERWREIVGACSQRVVALGAAVAESGSPQA